MTRVRIGKQWHPALVLLLGLAVSAGAHVGDRLYPVAWLSDEMLERIDLHDGLVEEWEDLIGEPSMTLLDFADLQGEKTPDPSDLDFRIWLAWHDDPARFYVAFLASDDAYKNTHDWSNSSRELIVNNDSIQLMIDGDHSGGAGGVNETPLEEWVEIAGRTQRYEAIARTPTGPTLDDAGTRVQSGEYAWTVFPPYGAGGGGVAGENPTIIVIELYVTPFDGWAGWQSPGEIAVSDLTAGQIVGFAISIRERESPPDSEWVDWVPEAMQSGGFTPLEVFRIFFHRRADGFLDGLLLSAGPAGPDGSAVESVSWGRIKAALEMK